MRPTGFVESARIRPSIISAAQLTAWMRELKASSEMLQLAESRLLKSKSLDPFALIELSTAALRNPGSVADQTLRMVQSLEILNLLVWSCGNG
jgi:hypothetical protein